MDPRFHTALLQVNVPALARLIQEGVDVNALSPNGCSALAIAAMAGSEKESEHMFRLIINAPTFLLDLRPNLLHSACQNWSIGIVRMLLTETDAMQELNEKDGHGWTPLHCAATRYDGQEIVSLLIERGAFLEAKSVTGNTALCIACNWRRFQNADLLIEAGADCSTRCKTDDFLRFILEHRRLMKRRILIMCGILRKRMGVCRDMVNLLARSVWATRFSKEWDDSRGTATIKK